MKGKVVFVKDFSKRMHVQEKYTKRGLEYIPEEPHRRYLL